MGSHLTSRIRKSAEEAPQARVCDMPQCSSHGEFRAPRSPENLNEYYWFCLDHVREFNKNWDYFDGMSAGEIESFMKDAVTGHRPTWRREDAFSFSTDRLMEELDRFMGWRSSRRRAGETLEPPTAAERRALSLLDMEDGYTMADLKSRYKQLVKQCHPDLNPGNQQAEEKFKKITAAYMMLNQRLKATKSS